MTNKFKIILFSIIISNLSGQSNNRLSLLSSFPNSLIYHEFNFVNNNSFNLFNGLRPLIINSHGTYNISYNYQAAFNIGHPNIDNNAEFFALNGLKEFDIKISFN